MSSKYTVHPMEQSFADWQRKNGAVSKIISQPLKYGDCKKEKLLTTDSDNQS